MSTDQEHQKNETEKLSWNNIKVPDNFFKTSIVPGVADNSNLSPNTPSLTDSGTPDPDNGDDPVILGQQLPNPYTIANMQQAYLQLYGSTAPVAVTHLYVRFKPANSDQLAALVDDDNLELQDYPMDYQVLQEGDYYQDPTLGTEDIGWLYTAVPNGYTPPSGIQYEILQQLHIPPYDDLLLESMAESLVGGAAYEDTVMLAYRYINRTDVLSDTLIVPNRLPTPCEIEPCGPNCPPVPPGEPDPCGGGGGGGGGGGTTYNPQIPRGTILVQDIRTCNNPSTVSNVPVRQARIVCKRWFKIWKGYTDDQGIFLATKKFKNRVKVLLKTVNNNAKISKVRGLRFWQILFPVKKRIGVYDQVAMANVNYLFSKPNPTNAHDKELPYWVATTTHNSVLEYGQYAGENGVTLPPTRLNMIVTNWGFQRGAGAAPLWKQCHFTESDLTLVQAFVYYFIVGPVISSSNTLTLANMLKNKMDIIIGYAASFADYNCRLTSANLKEVAYHELGHASHFAQAGCDYWQTYRTRISNELVTTVFDEPYGDGTETNAGVVALGEMWGTHIGYTFTDRHYGNGGAFGGLQAGGFTAQMQRTLWPNEVGGLNCYLRALENHNPNIDVNDDLNRWIPYGLPYDLIDDRNDAGVPIIDNVSGYTTQQCFNALQSDVRTIPAFRDRLLQQNGNNQFVNVSDLFFRYGYN